MVVSKFAPYLKKHTFFIVRNISPIKKVVRIFHYPILWRETRDILQIPGITEVHIRASLYKGEINYKLRAGDIEIVESDINLLEFNSDQKQIYKDFGITKGLEIDLDNLTNDVITYFTSNSSLNNLINFIDDGPIDLLNDSYKEIIGQPFPTQITWYTNINKTHKIIEKIINRVEDCQPQVSSIVWNSYQSDGSTILHSIKDTISYSNNFESTRNREIIQ